MLLSYQMLRVNREAIIKVKDGLIKALVQLALGYPKPVPENVLHPNTKILIEIWDKFFEYENNKGRVSLFRAIRKIMLCEYEHDAYYRHRIDWFIEQVVKAVQSGRWYPRYHDERKSECWKEPQ